MLIPLYLFPDFVFVWFLTLGWQSSQHSPVWTPTSSHQCLLKAQRSQLLCSARESSHNPCAHVPLVQAEGGQHWLLWSHWEGTSFPQRPWSYLNSFHLPAEHAFHLLWELLYKLQAIHLFDLQGWLHVFVFLPKGKQKTLLSGRPLRRGETITASWTLLLVTKDVLKEPPQFTFFSHFCVSSLFTL